MSGATTQQELEKGNDLKPNSAHIEEARQESAVDNYDGMAVVPDDDLSVWATLVKNPIVILCVMFGNVGAFMYGFDNISLSLCLDMAPFV